MGTCEDGCPALDLVNDIQLDSDGVLLVHHIHSDAPDRDEQQPPLIHDKNTTTTTTIGSLGGGGEEQEEEEQEEEEGEQQKQQHGEEAEEEQQQHQQQEIEQKEDEDEDEDAHNVNLSDVPAEAKGGWEEAEGLPTEYSDHPFPLRSNAEDCSFYMKTGSCKYGFSCRFNHPPNRLSQAALADAHTNLQHDAQPIFPPNPKIECKYYSTPGGCKFGESCRYSHSKEETDNEQLELNFLGLPIRKGERECPYYMRNGSCGYGANCRFHHPDPTATMEEPKNFEPTGGPLQGVKSFANRNFADCAPPPIPSMPRSISNSSSSENIPSYMPWMNNIPQRMPQSPQLPLYNQYQVPASLQDKTMNHRPGYSVTSPLKKADSFGYSQQLMQNEEFPERPGYPECDHFIKTGTCKFGSACRFHHPKSRLYSMPNGGILNLTKDVSHLTFHAQTIPMEEHPERPGEPECAYFMKTGECKFKSACKFNHPKGRNNKLAVSAIGMNGLAPRSAPIMSHEAKKLPDLYPNHQYQMAKPLMHHQQPRGEEFPERPGQPECEFFMKNGDCKFKAACKFHHPKSSRSQVSTGSDFALNEKGLPLRPGAKTCRNYEQLGICKYGPRCLFDHPSSSNSSAIPEPSAPQSPPVNNSGWGDGWEI